MMRVYPTLLMGLLFACAAVYLPAQDQHFSQFYASPQTLNPALTGAIDGTYRIGLNYRDQGRSMVEVPFTTASAGIDFRIGLDSRRKARSDKAGIGMVFYNDRSASVNFFTNYIGISGAFHKSLSKNEDQFLSVGFQGGIGQRNVNYDNFVFDDQFDGSGSFDLPSAEILPTNNFSYSDLAVGLNYAYNPEKGVGVFVGASMYHILEPEVSFFTEAEVPGTNQLFRKYSGHAGLRLRLASKIEMFPRALVYIQGPHTAINSGTNFRFEFGSNDNTAIHLGGWGRFTNNFGASMTWDAAVGMLGIEYNNFLIGFSYDAKILSLTSGGRPQGALEFSVTYIGNYENSDSYLCPSF
ncbi:MAG: PorP/SprF family type IX secretion system membrane protein [Bacteroidota bacterium]